MASGYYSAFDGLTIVDGSTTKHRSVEGLTDVVIDRTKNLASGTKVNYDGTSDASTHPGRARQQIVASGGGALTALDNLIAKIGMRGTLTRTKLATGTETCTAILEDVQVMSTTRPVFTYYEYIAYWNLETDWA